MNKLKIQKAEKQQRPLRAAIYGLSGGGKTKTSLRIGTGILEEEGGGKMLVVDTESYSASEYANEFEFDVLNLEIASIANYCDAINLAGQNGYRVLIIDSLSHGWQQLIEQVEILAKSKYKGNTWSAWAEGTPIQKKLIRAITTYPGHIIATMRAATEWSQQEGGGKSRPIRVGLKPEQGKGIEYEFDMLIAITQDHVAEVQKDRSGVFQDELINLPDEEFGKRIARAKKEGKIVEPKAEPSSITPTVISQPNAGLTDEQKSEIKRRLAYLGKTIADISGGKMLGVDDIKPKQVEAVIKRLGDLCEAKRQEMGEA